MPALPLHEAGKYVAAAYLVFLALLLIYVSIMAVRLSRVDGELEDLARLAEAVPAAPVAPEPGGNVAEGEASGGVIQEGARR
jgi:hypothetical protein